MKQFVLPKGRQALKDCLNSLPINIRYRVTVEEWKSRRSTDANNFYWGQVITPLADHCGYAPNEMHELLLIQLYGTKQISWGDKVVEVPRKRTHDMNKQEFTDHIARCQKVAVDLGVHVEQPEVEVEIP